MEKIKDFLRDAAIPIAGGIIGAFIGMGIARATLGINFENDMYKLTNEDCVTIYQESYK